MAEGTVAIAAIGLTGTILGLVVTPLFKLLQANTKALDNIAKTNNDLVSETRKGNIEAAERNGHLGEQNIQITEMLIDHNKIVSAMPVIIAKEVVKQANVSNQVVQNQTVEHQTVKE